MIITNISQMFYILIYFLISMQRKTKLKVENALKRIRYLQSALIVLKTDNGKDFAHKDSKTFCETNSIQLIYRRSWHPQNQVRLKELIQRWREKLQEPLI